MKLHIGHLLTLTSKIKQTAYRFFVYLLRYPVWEKNIGSLTCIPVGEVAEWNNARKWLNTSNHHRWMIYLLNSLGIFEFINVSRVNHPSILTYKSQWSYLNSPSSCEQTSEWMHFACYRSYHFRHSPIAKYIQHASSCNLFYLVGRCLDIRKLDIWTLCHLFYFRKWPICYGKKAMNPTLVSRDVIWTDACDMWVSGIHVTCTC
jgi:hypothetical protein